MHLSKSKYTKGIQCPKMLWMEANMPEQYDDSVMNQAVLANGNMVGDLAMGYFGEYVEVPFDPDDPERFSKAIARTQELLAAKTPVICEATFDYDGNYCMADILKMREDGTFDLIEVKSSTSCKEVYLHDMSYQAWVLENCGIKLSSVNLMHVNNQYVRQGDLDLHQYFALEDHTEEARTLIPLIPERIAHIKEVATKAPDDEPELAIGSQCGTPYPCGFKAWCWRYIPSPSVFDLNGITAKKAFSLYDQGIKTPAQAFDAKILLTPRQNVQAQSESEDGSTLINQTEVDSFLGTLSFPLYFLDFETMQPPVPLYDGTRAFQQIPTQYSLHVLRAEDAPLEHYEFLAESGSDPRRSVAEHLVADIPAGVCTLAYNMSFEKGRIAELAAAFPDLAEHLMSIADGMKDLIVPFKQGNYYLPAMGGSCSIKAVLPALFPNDPELNYHELEGVHNGGEAMAAFADLENMTPEEAAQTREQLLRYCELDTLAMVKIWRRLRKEE